MPRSFSHCKPLKMALSLARKLGRNQKLMCKLFVNLDRKAGKVCLNRCPLATTEHLQKKATKKQEKAILEHFSASPLRAKKLQHGYGIVPINYPIIYLSSEMLQAASRAKGRANQRKWALLIFATIVHVSSHWKLNGKAENSTKKPFCASSTGEAGFTLELQLFGGIITCPKYQIRVMPFSHQLLVLLTRFSRTELRCALQEGKVTSGDTDSIRKRVI